MRNSFIFLSSYYEAVQDLPEDEQAKVYKAIIEYAMLEKIPDFTGVEKTIFTLVKPDIDKSIAQFKNGKRPKNILNEEEVIDLIDMTFRDADVKAKFLDYVEMRKGKKDCAVRTKATFYGCVQKLRKYAKTKQEALDVLQQSIDSCWIGLFPLKHDFNRPTESGVPPYAN